MPIMAASGVSGAPRGPAASCAGHHVDDVPENVFQRGDGLIGRQVLSEKLAGGQPFYDLIDVALSYILCLCRAHDLN